jgi:hypothetical protein
MYLPAGLIVTRRTNNASLQAVSAAAVLRVAVVGRCCRLLWERISGCLRWMLPGTIVFYQLNLSYKSLLFWRLLVAMSSLEYGKFLFYININYLSLFGFFCIFLYVLLLH